MNFRKITKVLSCLVLALVALTLVGCGPKEGEGQYTYSTYTAVSPSNWNELTYQDNNDTQIMSYIGSAFYSYNFKYDANGAILPGEFVMEYEAATALKDVSAEYAEAWGLPAGQKGYAYQITLRQDLCWEDGTPIKAEDFVYSMQEQLNPLFQNYRADSFYVGATIIKNAEAYVKQGQTTFVDNCIDADAAATTYAVADLVKGDDGVYDLPNGRPVKFALKTALAWCGGDTVTDCKSYLDADSYDALAALADEDGNVDVTDETIALVTTLIDTDDWGHEPASNVPLYMVYEKEFEAVAWEKVGMFVGPTEYDIVLVLDKALPLLKEDGSLSYQAAYNMASLPLVKKDLYESCKVAPTTGNTLWTTTYNTSKETSAAWGPYKLESFQSGKEYVLVRNDKWFGYNDAKYEGQYQTDKIVCKTVEEWNTAWLMFLAGEIDGIGIDVSVADDYKGSDRAYYTPDDFVASLQLQSSKEQLKARESEGINKTILTYTDFRKALSLAINRADFATKTTTSSLAGFGLFNSMHYYDVENGGVYRNTDAAKQVLCDIYGVDVSQFNSLDEAAESITGYDLEQARELVRSAYAEALANGDIKETDKVELTFGTSAINETVTRRHNYIKEAWIELVKETPLEGRLQFSADAELSAAWATDFRAGKYDVCMGGWSGAAWDPGYFLLAYLSPAYMYSTAWDTSSQEMTFQLPGVMDEPETMTLMEWYNCLNGVGDYDFSANELEQEQRLPLIAALEKEVLQVYYSVPLYNSFAASLISYKVDYVTYEYNTFMGYGGVRYMTYNFDDYQWAKEVAKNNNELNYK